MAQNQGTGYTNLQSYLNANKGNQLGGALSSDIQGVTDNANNQLNQQVGNFNQGLQNETNSLSNQYNSANSNVNTLANNPTTFNTSDLSQVQGYQNAQYGGPTNLSNTAALNAQAQNVNGLGQLAGSQGGRAQLLGEFVGSGNPQYTQAAQNLDSLFLGNNVDSQLQGSRTAANQYSNNVNQQEDAAQFKAGAAQGSLGQQQQQLNNNISGIGTTLNNVLTSRLGAANAQDTAYNQAIANQNLSGLSGQDYNVPTSALSDLTAANQFGIGNNYFNALTQGSTAGQNANLAGVATTNDRAQAAALAQLLNNPSYNAEATGPAYVAPTLSVNTGGNAQQVLQNEYNTLLGSNLNTLANSSTPSSSQFSNLANALAQPNTVTSGGTTTLGTFIGNPGTQPTSTTNFNPNALTLQQALALPSSPNGTFMPYTDQAQQTAISNLQAYLNGTLNQPASATPNTAITSSGNSNLPGYTQALPVSAANATILNPAATAPTVLPTNFNPAMTQNYTDPNTGANWIYNGSSQTWQQNTANPGY